MTAILRRQAYLTLIRKLERIASRIEDDHPNSVPSELELQIEDLAGRLTILVAIEDPKPE